MDAPVLHILIDEDGIARTINRRVKVKMIVQKHIFADEALEDIADHYGIQLSDVYAALTYYYDNREQMDADFERSEALLKEVGISGEALKAKILQRMQEMKGSQ
jgi:uncharacterized protein (DUF433 family)